MNMDVIDCNVLYFKDNWVCPTRRPGRVCLRRTPTALGLHVVCSTDLEEVVVKSTNVGRLNGRTLQ